MLVQMNGIELDMIHRSLHLINSKMPLHSKALVNIIWSNLIKIMNQCLPQKVYFVK